MSRKCDIDLNWAASPVLIPLHSDREGRFALAAPWEFWVTRRNEERGFVLPVGYVTDGASVPLIFRYLAPQSGKTWPAALAHDALYATLGFTGLFTRGEADFLFCLGLLKNGVGFKRATVMFEAVKWFGGRGWRDVSDTDELNRAMSWWAAFAKGEGRMTPAGRVTAAGDFIERKHES